MEKKSHFWQAVNLFTVCYWRAVDDTRELPISNLASTDKKFSTDSLPASSNDNRLYGHLLVIPAWQWLSFLKESQSFFPRRCISQPWNSTTKKFQKTPRIQKTFANYCTLILILDFHFVTDTEDFFLSFTCFGQCRPHKNTIQDMSLNAFFRC